MGDNRCITGAVRHVDGFQGFAQRANLVELDKNGIRYVLLNALLQNLRIGNKQIIAYQLYPGTQPVTQNLPALPVTFIHAIFNGNDWILVNPGSQVIGETIGIE